jgi:hypothetical protein
MMPGKGPPCVRTGKTVFLRKDLTPAAEAAESELRCPFQEIDRLTGVLERLLNRPVFLGARADMCCYSTEAVVQNLGGCP